MTNIFAYFISQKEREYNITHIEIDFNFCKIFSLSTNFGNHITEIDFSCYKFLFFSPPILVITSPKLILIFFLSPPISGSWIFWAHKFRQSRHWNSFFSFTITSFLSSLPFSLFSEFRQWYCQNSLPSSFFQISLNYPHTANKLNFMQYSVKRLWNSKSKYSKVVVVVVLLWIFPYFQKLYL